MAAGVSARGVRIISLEWNPRHSAPRTDEVATVPEARVVEIEPALLNVTEAARYLACGRTTLFMILREGRIRSIRRGRRRLIPRSELDKFVAEEVARQQEKD